MALPLDNIVRHLEECRDQVNNDMSIRYLCLYNDAGHLRDAFGDKPYQVSDSFELLVPDEYSSGQNFLITLLRQAKDRMSAQYGYTQDFCDATSLLCKIIDLHVSEKKDVLHRMEAIETYLTEKIMPNNLEKDRHLLKRHDVYRRFRSIVPETDIHSLQTLAQASKANHDYTAGHGARVMFAGMGFLDWLYTRLGPAFVPRQEFINARDGMLLHDIGKTARSRDVLNAARKLTAEEWDDVRLHPTEGEAIIMNIPALADERTIVRSHHERWDGKGYPDHTEGDSVPLLARVCAIADVYDALTSERAYREQLTPKAAATIVRDNAGSQFDPELGRLFYMFMDENCFRGETMLADNETKWIDLRSQGIIQ